MTDTPRPETQDRVDHIDLLLDDDLRAFRRDVRAFLSAAVPAQTRARIDNGYVSTKPEFVAFLERLSTKGWIAPGWPTEHGGPGWSQLQRFVYNIELARSGAPTIPPFGTSMVGPVLYTFGTDAQKARYLPGILSGKEFWCQGFSEPGSGSDLASLRTKAEDKGDHYLLNGQKIWTSKAQYADHIFLLARTDEGTRKQDGISFFVLSMDTPGIAVKPIISIDMNHSLNEVFFTDVKIPRDGLVGERGKGWSYAKFLLGNERTGITNVGRCRRQIVRLKGLARANGLASDGAFLAELARVEADLVAMEITEIRLLSAPSGAPSAMTGPSVLKLKSAQIQQTLQAMIVSALGPMAAARGPEFVAAFDGDATPPAGFVDGAVGEYLFGRAASIYGGTNQIQRDILAKTALDGRA